jgi:hypothetical protein
MAELSLLTLRGRDFFKPSVPDISQSRDDGKLLSGEGYCGNKFET